MKADPAAAIKKEVNPDYLYLFLFHSAGMSIQNLWHLLFAKGLLLY